MMHFCFLAKIVSFQKVAQNLSSRLKRAIESRTQQHTMPQFSSLEEKGVMYTKLILDLPVGIFVPVEYQSSAHDTMPQTQGCVRYSPEN